MNFAGVGLWQIGVWALSTLGVVGTITMLILFPKMFWIIVRAVVRFFQIVLAYRVGCAIVAAIMAWIIADYVRHSIDDAEFARRTAEFEQAQVARDRRIASETRLAVNAELIDQTKRDDTTDREVKEFKDAKPPVPFTGNPFRVGDAADKLRRIAGQTERRPGGASKRVPAARPKAERSRN